MKALEEIIKATALTMPKPRLYGPFHIICAALGIILAIIFAFRLKRLTERRLIRLLFVSGLFLCITEVWKQLFIYYVINDSQYLWERFPFQLCSVPMYLMVLLPFVRGNIKKSFLGFMPSFAFLGGVVVYIDPTDMLSPYLFLTLHSFIWHFLLIFCGLITALNYPRQKFIYPLVTYYISALIAIIINTVFHTRGYIAMFYLSPYYPMTQIVFRDISKSLGIFWGMIVYTASTDLGAYGFYRMAYFFSKRSISR